ncbi:MAG: peptidase domain-containing ABC transporter [Flavobacteriales bacterium]|nr:peptidase domain-containing ABC transporter [Flavobacteriales bacterium]MBX2960402.1 peptidase domain-containing ABC transporter [Flavobacteriales bacterium]
MPKFPISRQPGAMDCGATCLKMISEFYGKKFSINFLKKKTHVSKEGVSFANIIEAAETIGLRSTAAKLDLDAIEVHNFMPCIIHWKQNHFIILYKISGNKVYVADPGAGLIKYSKTEFETNWKGKSDVGVALNFKPSSEFYQLDLSDDEKEKTQGLSYLINYLKGYNKYYVQLFLGFFVGSFILLLTPFLSQAIIDKGINNLDLNFVYLILIAQALLYVGRVLIDIFRRWILLHIGTRISISLVSDFLFKLLKLPISFFENHLIGDLLQRIEEHDRIKQLLTVNSLAALFSVINLVVFGTVLLIYDFTIFFIFFTGTALSLLWILMSLKARKKHDIARFGILAKNKEKTIELIKGINEIKLNNNEKQKRWEWEEIQAKLFLTNLKWESVQMTQNVGVTIIEEAKNIIISFVSAKAVIEGDITLGAMFSINMIVGQLFAPVASIIQFIMNYADAKISVNRIEEVRNETDEIDNKKHFIEEIKEDNEMQFDDVSFSYMGTRTDLVLKKINLTVLKGKQTAIVGKSGSGKSTLMKLMLKFHEPTDGMIQIGNFNFTNVNPTAWRKNIGVVLQDGYIFSDTIFNNVAMGKEDATIEEVINASKIACIHDFISENLPLGYQTIIGSEGISLSKGQHQRLLIARAVIKNPKYIFMDESTSALDTSTEKKLMDNLNKYFTNRTVVVIAHRLSTIKNSDQILVIDQGKITEKGTHDELVNQKGYYFQLVKDQIELD